ncbi:hypothetical protein M899_1114 [Bacteriovorax sp. BSW11_IV]|uniref:hypothetical protein n=1 Tax=Bacteriovorax sp. BSW11_IV TaxID=1353529 RepID=UPI00038A152C|nr:hypothetical protein [Bacteriovorax sp. BSW11_IV]EQC46763.1 hypothetical protein M899_1114 [Bacteriovorax sp. BSW11_IV]
MRIFNAFENQTTQTTNRKTHKKNAASEGAGELKISDERVKQHAPPNVNERDVRAKLERAKQKNMVMTPVKKVNNHIPDHPEAVNAKKAERAPSIDTEKKESEEKKDLLLKSDIATNDPKDPRVQEKLKDALQNGAFKFNDKEREVLAQILG